MTVIALFAVVLISLSAHTERVFQAAEGYSAPQFTISDNAKSIGLADLKGRYVLVNFWSVTDAQSRVLTNSYDALARRASDQLTLVSVNMDTDISLYRETIDRDHLKQDVQFHVNGPQASALVENYNLQQGMRSFLIDPAGKIIAINPSSATIASVIDA